MAGDASYANVGLLLHGDGANGSTTITDSSSVPSTITAFGNAQISTAQSKFGGASIKFDGSGDRVSVPFSTKLDMGSGDWTLELQYYPVSASTSDRVYQTRDGDVVPSMYLAHNSATQLQFYWASTSSFQGSGIAFSIAQNVWQHIAIVNNGGTVRAYVNGVVQGASYSITGSMYKAGDESVIIGGQTSGRTINGYLDEVRLTKGVARYTTTFTPPAAAFPDYTAQISGTVVDSTGTPASRTVRAYRRDTGAFLKEGVSTSGSYTLNLTYAGEVNVICLDDVAGTTENDLILRTTAS